MLKLEQWPSGKIPPGAVAKIEDIEGRRRATRLYANEPILENKLLGRGAAEQGASGSIPKGYRPVSVKVDLVSGGSNLILPGDRVDVMVHLVKDPAATFPKPSHEPFCRISSLRSTTCWEWKTRKSPPSRSPPKLSRCW